MKVLVTCERRYKRLPDGSIWTTSIDGYEFWQRYLAVFEAVTVLGRVEDVTSLQTSWKPTTGPGVGFVGVPFFAGPLGYLRRYRIVRQACGGAVSHPDTIILRTPGIIALIVEDLIRKSGRPFGVEVVGDPFDVFARGSIDHPLRPILRWFFSRSLRRQCRNAAVASYVTEGALQQRYPPGSDTISTHYSSISLLDEAFAFSSRTPGSFSSPLTLVSVGSLEQRYKGFDDLIRAVGYCRDQGAELRLVLVGGGRYLSSLRRLAGEIGVRVEFTGELPGPEAVRHVLRNGDLFVSPSRTEGLPRVMIEAMATALPCIGTSVGGTGELLNVAYLVEPRDPKGMAAKISGCVRDPQCLSQMSRENLERAFSYRESVLQGRRIEIYRRLREITEGYLRASGKNVENEPRCYEPSGE